MRLIIVTVAVKIGVELSCKLQLILWVKRQLGRACSARGPCSARCAFAPQADQNCAKQVGGTVGALL